VTQIATFDMEIPVTRFETNVIIVRNVFFNLVYFNFFQIVNYVSPDTEYKRNILIRYVSLQCGAFRQSDEWSQGSGRGV